MTCHLRQREALDEGERAKRAQAVCPTQVFGLFMAFSSDKDEKKKTEKDHP